MKSTDKEINKAIEQFLKEKNCSTINEAQDVNKYLKSETWKEKEATFLNRIGHRCEICRATNNVRAFHNNYARIYTEQDEDLLALCEVCQKKRNSKIKQKHISNKKRVGKKATKKLKKSVNSKKAGHAGDITNSYGVIENSYTEQYQKIYKNKNKNSNPKIKESKNICFSCCNPRVSSRRVKAYSRVIRLCTKCFRMFGIKR
jgi:hypothetical protein